MLQPLYALLFTLILASCQSANHQEATLPPTAPKLDSITIDSNNTTDEEPTDSLTAEEQVDYALYRVVIVDTGYQYEPLLQTLYAVEKKTGLQVDLMGRYFDQKKKEIILPEDDEDELYAGSYFPRRYPSNTLSIEYLNTFLPAADNKKMAIIATIAEGRRQADSLVRVLTPHYPHTYSISSKVFIGCLH